MFNKEYKDRRAEVLIDRVPGTTLQVPILQKMPSSSFKPLEIEVMTAWSAPKHSRWWRCQRSRSRHPGHCEKSQFYS